ncbi:hypothetical protein B0H14DRAFT_2613082 [Mycena olivaceomarginata]|nr:hypothetical protein B0H14DRAFT_2613082 [Mycena olivaceomarginata]
MVMRSNGIDSAKIDPVLRAKVVLDRLVQETKREKLSKNMSQQLRERELLWGERGSPEPYTNTSNKSQNRQKMAQKIEFLPPRHLLVKRRRGIIGDLVNFLLPPFSPTVASSQHVRAADAFSRGLFCEYMRPPANFRPIYEKNSGVTLDLTQIRKVNFVRRGHRSQAVFVSSSLGQTAAMEEDKERGVEGDKLDGDEPKPYKRNLVISLKKR